MLSGSSADKHPDSYRRKYSLESSESSISCQDDYIRHFIPYQIFGPEMKI